MNVRQIIALLVAITTISVASWLFIQWANSPVEKEISIASESNVKKETTQNLVTDYFTTKLPADFTVQFADSKTDQKDLRVVAFEHKNGQVQIGITSTLLASDGLNGVGDYTFRIKRSDLYTIIDTTQFPVDSTTFQKKSDDEITTFMIHNNRYVSVSISGQSVTGAEVISIRKMIADNWVWI